METSPAEATWTAWRSRAVSIILAIVAVCYLPALASPVALRPVAGPPWLQTVSQLTAVAMVVCALAWKAPYRLRAGVWIGAMYVISVIGLFRVGLPGVGRIWLLPLGMIALILLGRRAGIVVAIISAATVAVFTALAYAGVVGRWFTVEHNPTEGHFWLLQTATWLMAMVPAMVLSERFLAHQEHLLCAERATVRRLEAEMSARVRLEREVVEASERERRDVGHELHDGICQQLTGARLRCQALERALRAGAPAEPEQLLAIRELLDESLAHAYELSRGLRPMELDPASLGPSLSDLARKVRTTHELECDTRITEPHGIRSGVVATQLYRIAQEAVNNAVKHGSPGQITVSLRHEDGRLELEVADDGRGFAELPQDSPGMGLRILQFRARAIGATLAIESKPGAGTRIRCRLDAAALEPATDG